MDSTEIKSMIGEVEKLVHHQKEAMAEAKASTDALVDSKLAKVSEELLAKLDESQKANAEMLAKMQRPMSGESAEKEVELKNSAAFNQFLKKGAGSTAADFADYLNQKGMERELKALSVNSDVDGGFLVLPTFGGVINTRVFETSPLRQLATVVTINSDQWEAVLDNDEASCGWVGEESARTDTNTPTFDKRIIPVHEIYAQPVATQKMLDDGIVNIEQWLAGKVSDKFARTEATAFVSGNGVAQPFGILTNTTTSTSYDGRNVQVINSGTSATVTYAGLASLQNGLKEFYQTNAVWLMQRATFGSVMQIKTGISGDNRPIFNMMYDKNTGLPVANMLGRPVMFAADMPAVATDAKAIAYGDFRAAYTIVDRSGIRVLRDPYTNKPFVKFYSTKRVGGDVVNAEAIKIQALT